MATAIQNLRDHDPELQVLGAAYIQHECYSDSDAKVEVLKERLDSWLEFLWIWPLCIIEKLTKLQPLTTFLLT